jgi:STAS-like domain of unknown function (DUF4325)
LTRDGNGIAFAGKFRVHAFNDFLVELEETIERCYTDVVAVVIDWAGVPLISSSFADEAFGKLFIELGPLTFGSRIKHRNMEAVNAGLVNKAILQRAAQQVAESNVKPGPIRVRPRGR